ncbi:MAG: hypothetical protein IJ422_01910 [Oscillospiraceae bacterium]|nr:hypothetical protein [Oscillospiraceae bacterium]
MKIPPLSQITIHYTRLSREKQEQNVNKEFFRQGVEIVDLGWYNIR